MDSSRSSKQRLNLINKLLVVGDSQKQVHLEGYQVSGQCQALVRDGILLPTKDAPELGYIRDCSPQHYVPDVYYKVRTFGQYSFRLMFCIVLETLKDFTGVLYFGVG